jgi:hypothetical protein
MNSPNDVKEVRALGSYRLGVAFQDGYIGEVDLKALFERLKGPMTEPFTDAEFFQRVAVDPETHVVMWPNGYDICSDVLRYYCEQGRVTSDEERNANFNRPDTVASFNDKPNE